MQRDLVRNTVLSVPGVVQVRARLMLESSQEAAPEKVPVLPEKKIESQITVPPTMLAPAPVTVFPPPPTKGPAIIAPPPPTVGGMPPEPTPIFQVQPGMLPNPPYQQPPL